MYRVTFSNGFTTVIDWDGLNTNALSVVWDIINCWYNVSEMEGVTITAIKYLIP